MEKGMEKLKQLQKKRYEMTDDFNSITTEEKEANFMKEKPEIVVRQDNEREKEMEKYKKSSRNLETKLARNAGINNERLLF